MSAIGGVLLPAAPGAPRWEIEAALHRMGGVLSGFGPDGYFTAIRGRAGMLHRPLCIAFDARRERQPHAASDGLLLVWDGRLDNVGELARRLETIPPTAGEVEVVAAAYRRWASGLLEHLVGDFAFALWDPRVRTLLLARDPFGTRPLFYSERGGALAWASSLRALLAGWTDLPLDLDEEWIAGYLTGEEPEGRTPYRALREVPPGGAVLLADDRCREILTWPPMEIPGLSIRNDREAEERFLELFTDAVRCRLRGAGPVFCELSGGVDSSSIACVADRLLRGGQAEAGGLETVSWVFDGAPTSDEREWIRIVEARTGCRGHHLREEDGPLLAEFEDAWFEIPSYLTVFHLRHRLMGELLHRAGCRVLLSGVGGDNLVWSEYAMPPQLADFAAAGRLLALVRELSVWQHGTGLPYGKLVWEGVVRPLLRIAMGKRPGSVPLRTSWFGAALTRHSAGRDQAPGRPAVGWLVRPSQRQHLAAISLAVRRQISPSYLEAELMSVEMSFPFLHRPLVEFCLALPVDQFARPLETRSLHRRALRTLLPPKIVWRKDKRGPDEALIHRFGEAWPRLMAMFGAEARVFELGFVERAPFLAAMRKKRFGLLDRSRPVEVVIALEVWLRGLDRFARTRAAA